MLLNTWVSPNSSLLTSNWTETELSLKISISSCYSFPDTPIFVHNKKLEKMEKTLVALENFLLFPIPTLAILQQENKCYF